MSVVAANVVEKLRGDFYRLKEPSSLMVSSELRGLLDDCIAVRCGKNPTKAMFFRGLPIVECQLLSDLEYAFVNSAGQET